MKPVSALSNQKHLGIENLLTEKFLFLNYSMYDYLKGTDCFPEKLSQAC